jgi:hypothetical protein
MNESSSIQRGRKRKAPEALKDQAGRSTSPADKARRAEQLRRAQQRSRAKRKAATILISSSSSLEEQSSTSTNVSLSSSSLSSTSLLPLPLSSPSPPLSSSSLSSSIASNTILPVGRFPTLTALRQWRIDSESSLSLSLKTEMINNTIRFAHKSLLSALEENSGFPLPTVQELSDNAIDVVFCYCIEKTGSTSSIHSSVSTRLMAIANLICVLLYFASFGCRCMCAGQLSNTDCTQFHRGGRCGWMASLDGGWDQLTIDHNPQKKSQHPGRWGWSICVHSTSTAIEGEIASWRWKTGSKDSGPFKCITCNRFRRNDSV